MNDKELDNIEKRLLAWSVDKEPLICDALRAIVTLRAREKHVCATRVGSTYVYLKDGTKVVLRKNRLRVEEQEQIKLCKATKA